MNENQNAKNQKSYSIKSYAWRQFRKNKPALVSLYVLVILILIAVFADFIANKQPLYAQYQGKTFYPAWTTFWEPTHVDSVRNPETGEKEYLQFDITNWKTLKLDDVIWAPIPYSPGQADPYNRGYVSPFGKQHYKNPAGDIVEAPTRFRHFLGTDQIGQDIASGLIHGTRVSLTVGIVAMAIAGFIGILLGSLAGYFGDRHLKMPAGQLVMLLLGVLLGGFYGFLVRTYSIKAGMDASIGKGLYELTVSILILLAFLLIFSWVGKKMSILWGLSKELSVPVDATVLRLMEILRAIPGLILLLTISAVFKEKSLLLLMAIIGLISWTGIARFTRAEFLRTRSLDYIEAARALGMNEKRVIFRHALPNSIAPVFVAMAFGIAMAIITESSLSFLGIGVPDDVVTWGSLLNEGQERFTAWWLVVFPGMAIFITVTVFNLIGDALRDATDPKLRD